MRCPRLTRPALQAVVLVVLAAAVLVTPPAAAETGAGPQANVVPIQVTGPAATRFNLIVLGDGYTAAEQPKFRAQVDKHLNVLWSIEPFKSYRSYFNVYAVEIASPESGVDCDPSLESPRRNTPLEMGFWGGCNPNSVQRLLTVSASAAASYADLVPQTTASNRQILALGNSETYGGAGGSYATATGGNALSALITPHELGHSLGGLQDEYDYLQRGQRGAAYTGPEPASVHHTLLTEAQMRQQQKKWWRWLGEPSESGGTIGRYEAGMYSGSGVWRPSRHSMMKTLGYYFDQVSRERMTQRIAAKASLIQGSTPTGPPVAGDQVVWLDTLHPLSHELAVSWSLDGTALPGTRRSLDLGAVALTPGSHTLTATVTDPTGFVRDLAVRPVATRTWTVDPELRVQPSTEPVRFTGSTATDRPVSGNQVVYAETTHPADRVPSVTWTLDGRPVTSPGNDLDLGRLGLTGRHTLTAATEAGTLRWDVDANGAVVQHQLSRPLARVDKPTGPEYIFNGPFTMKLTPSDDSAGYVVPEFRVNGNGWYNYFGWPTDADAPFRFTAEGTNIDQLVYGKLGVPRVVPWDDVPSGYGRHRIEYRAIDATGNIGTPRSMVTTLLREPPACTRTITAPWSGPLIVASGVTCLTGATVSGPVSVRSGATLVALDARISGPVTGSVHLLRTTVSGPVRVRQAGAAVVVGSTIAGPLEVTGSTDPVIAANTIAGPLSCSGNTAAPTNLEAPNTVAGPRSGQCATL